MAEWCEKGVGEGLEVEKGIQLEPIQNVLGTYYFNILRKFIQYILRLLAECSYHILRTSVTNNQRIIYGYVPQLLLECSFDVPKTICVNNKKMFLVDVAKLLS